MCPTTDDPNDPRLSYGVDLEPRAQSAAYLVMSKTERDKGFARPLRDTYRHTVCHTTTSMAPSIAETYARDPKFYGATYCCRCRMHLPVSQFQWLDGSTVGS